VTGKDTGKDIGKATLINTLGRDEAKRRLAACLLEADRCLGAAIGANGRTRHFVSQLFSREGKAKRFAPELAKARESRDSRPSTQLAELRLT